ncbi:hypothetical protein ACFXPA_35295 [Amycolatopsis sp. NPDC059090]|uniref:hypothetical protein n=1 Tax=unclassified Amycolatopsis TaxID=2618356 RepID=UPI00366B1444
MRIAVTPVGASEFSGGYDETVAYLRDNCNVELNRDYALSKLSPGGVFATGDEIRLFELAAGSRDLFAGLTISVELEGTLRDTYSKNIYCIPSSGIPPAPQS